jgi:hypothetical protein
LLPAVAETRGAAWGDGLAGIRYHRELGGGYGLTGMADIGAGGANIDWEAKVSLDYRVTPTIDLHAGFSSLNVEYANKSATFDTHIYGPFLSATFHFSP